MEDGRPVGERGSLLTASTVSVKEEKQNYVCESSRWIRSLGLKKREEAQERFKRSGEWRMDSSLWVMGYSLGSGQVHTAQLIRMLTFSQNVWRCGAGPC